jgi:tRNA threonylcarbamoyladenosine biosynthesis protein TsaE
MSGRVFFAVSGPKSDVLSHFCPDEAATRVFASELAQRLRPGAVVLLEGPLGAGKTTFVRGFLEALGYASIVRSPTFNLVQTFATVPPVAHADLYRVPSSQGLGLEELMESHVLLVEWPDRAEGLFSEESCWRVSFAFEGKGRRIEIQPPAGEPPLRAN